MYDQSKTIAYLTGDATRPVGNDPKAIVHVCNDIGGWGSGFVLALSKRWREPEAAYRAWHAGDEPEAPDFELGQVQFVPVEDDLHVANLIGQQGVGRRPDGSPPPPCDCVGKKSQQIPLVRTRYLGLSTDARTVGRGTIHQQERLR